MKSQRVHFDAYVTIVKLKPFSSTFALENIVLLYFRFYLDKRDKPIRLTVFHCERTATKNITFTVVV